MGRHRSFACTHRVPKRGPFTAFLMAVLAAVCLLAPPERCGAFGPEGHLGVFRGALGLLNPHAGSCATIWPDPGEAGSREVLEVLSNYPDTVLYFPNALVYEVTIGPIEFAAGPVEKVIIPEKTYRFEVKEWDYVDALNSSDHYFDPTRPLAVTNSVLPEEDLESIAEAVTGKLVEQFLVLAGVDRSLWPVVSPHVHEPIYPVVYQELAQLHTKFQGTARSFQQCLQERQRLEERKDGVLARSGADGTGYNAITAILFCLNGREGVPAPSVPLDNDLQVISADNPCSLVRPEGFIQLASIADRGDYQGDSAFNEAFLNLGCSVHYVADLFSPGHTEWHSWYQKPPLGYPRPDHGDFDTLGDLHIGQGIAKARVPQLILRFNRPPDPAPCSVISGRGLGTERMPYPAEFWEMDLPAALYEVAQESRGMWQERSTLWAGQAFRDDFKTHRFPRHLAKSVELAAGVIDWAFSRAAEADGPYQRDATNFFGMAAGLLRQHDNNAVIKPVTSMEREPGARAKEKDCTLGGIDQDDYFPLTDNKYRRIWITVWDGWEGGAVEAGKIKAEVFDLSGSQLAEGVPKDRKLEIDLGEMPPRECLLRVYSPDGDKFTYTFDFSDEEEPPEDEGMLDVVVLIDKSGSMVDDIEVVKEQVDTLLSELAALAEQENISLQVGLVTFMHTGTDNVFEVSPLTEDTEPIRRFITQLSSQDVSGDEDLYAAMMYAMNEEVDGKKIEMGWRHLAAKIAIPITDEMPKNQPFTLADVVETAFNLDPVHVYPLIMPKAPLSWLDPAVSALEELASATGGEAVQVESAEELPDAIIAAVKLAIRRHKEEVWRKENPPYVLYSVGAGIGAVVVLALVVLLVRGIGRVPAAEVASASADARLSGQTKVTPETRRGE